MIRGEVLGGGGKGSRKLRKQKRALRQGGETWQGFFPVFPTLCNEAVSASMGCLVLGKSLGMTLLTSNMFKDAEKCTICSPLIFFSWVWIQTRRMQKAKNTSCWEMDTQNTLCVFFTVFCDIKLSVEDTVLLLLALGMAEAECVGTITVPCDRLRCHIHRTLPALRRWTEGKHTRTKAMHSAASK